MTMPFYFCTRLVKRQHYSHTWTASFKGLIEEAVAISRAQVPSASCHISCYLSMPLPQPPLINLAGLGDIKICRSCLAQIQLEEWEKITGESKPGRPPNLQDCEGAVWFRHDDRCGLFLLTQGPPNSQKKHCIF